MSWRATAYVAELTADLTPAEKLVLMCLANRHHQDTGLCNPSVSRLAEESLTSERNLPRILARLRAKGFLRYDSEHGRGRTNVYEIVGVEGVATGKPDRLAPFSGRRKPDRLAPKTRQLGAENLTENLTDQALKPDTAVSPEQGNGSTRKEQGNGSRGRVAPQPSFGELLEIARKAGSQ